MARKRAEQPPLRFRGAPPGLESIASQPLLGTGEEGGVTIKLPGEVAELAPRPLHASPIGTTGAYLRFSLPETTPPGSYSGTARIGGAEYPVVAEVEPFASLRAAPTMLTLEATPGAHVEAHVTLLNDGNVAYEIGKTYAFGLFDQEGIERGFGVAFEDESTHGQERFGRFVEELADHHGGLIRVQIREGSGSLAPGDVRSVAAVFRFPEGLAPGRIYSSTWPLGVLNYPVRTLVAAKHTTPRRKAG